MAGANSYDFLGEGTNPSVAPAADPDDQPNPSNPGGLSNNQIRLQAHNREQVSAQGAITANNNIGYQTSRQNEIDDTGALNHQIRMSSAGQANNGFAAKLVPNLAATALTAFNPFLGAAAHIANNQLLFKPGNDANEKDRAAVAQQNANPTLPGLGTPLLGGGGAARVHTGDPIGAGGVPGAPVAGSTAADQANAMGDQLMAGAGAAAPRTDQASEDVRSFLDEERNRKGSSEAEALLNKTADRIQSQALGLAAGARGGAGARERATNQAISGNAFVGASATQDLAVLRAKEDQQKRDRLLTIMNLLSANAGRGDVLQQGQQGQAVDMYGRAIGATQAAEGNASTERTNAANNASNERSTALSAKAGSANIAAHDAFTRSERKDVEPGFEEEAFKYGSKALDAYLQGQKKDDDLFA